MKIDEKILISIPKEGKEFTSRELIAKFGSQEIKEKLKTNGMHGQYTKKTIERLEANGCSCVNTKKGIYFVKYFMPIGELQEESLTETLEEALKKAELEGDDTYKTIVHQNRKLIRPLSNMDWRLLGGKKQEYPVRRILGGLFLSKMIQASKDEDVQFFNGEKTDIADTAYGHKTRFFLRNLNALNLYNYACGQTPLSDRKRKTIAEKFKIPLIIVEDFTEALQDCLSGYINTTFNNMHDAGLIEYKSMSWLGKIEHINQRDSKMQKNTTPGKDEGMVDCVILERDINYRKLTNEEELEYLKIKAKLEEAFPAAKSYYNLIRMPKAMKFRRDLLMEKIGISDCLLISELSFTHTKEAEAFMSYYDDFTEEKYLNDFFEIIQNNMIQRKCVSSLTETEKELIKVICKAMLDPNKENLFSQSEIHLDNIIDFTNFSTLNIIKK